MIDRNALLPRWQIANQQRQWPLLSEVGWRQCAQGHCIRWSMPTIRLSQLIEEPLKAALVEHCVTQLAMDYTRSEVLQRLASV